ncbi:MAG: hypothetical protein JNK64_12975 [Myxococcales bacterium]|nr:hypothetical protein [Myxococcales bacterium]
MRAAIVIVVMLGWLAAPRAASADEQALADVQWGWVTFELGGAATIAVAAYSDVPGDRLALAGGLGSIAAAITAGIVADATGAPLAGANAVHGALMLGAEGALIGAIADRDHRGPRVRRLAVGAGLLGAAAGGWIGATRIPDDSLSPAWTYAPIAGFTAGVVIAAGAELFAPSAAPARRGATIIAVTSGAAILAAALLADRHIGAIYPQAPAASPLAAPRLIGWSGVF